jgi:hypothetical protein
MTQWHCEACGAVYDRERGTCRHCEAGRVTRAGESGGLTEGIESEKAESFQKWGFVDWVLLGVTLGGFASMTLGLLRIVGV